MPRNFVEMAAVTDPGSVRQFNEDSIVTGPDLGLAVLADGMGGHRAGEVASGIATQVIFETLQAQLAELRSDAGARSPVQAIDKSINRANKAVFDAAQGQPSYQGMGTTLALALFYDNRAALGHIGDSRIYRLRNDVLHLLTRDDSLLRDQIELGLVSAADAGGSHNRSLVTRALGTEESLRAHLREDEVVPGDIYVLCSDGLNDLVEDADIELIVRSLRTNLPLAAHHLVQAAKDNGGYDNVSVILVKVLKPFPAADDTRWLSRLLRWFR
ncbi:MAG TPA: protein phosphatase 2C domain-containing protein [Casimicrobiaceae bacterium]|nr:protein phosphatase 2C domain-containing protein [Casimicrobiaceae bacterium]